MRHKLYKFKYNIRVYLSLCLIICYNLYYNIIIHFNNNLSQIPLEIKNTTTNFNENDEVITNKIRVNNYDL